MVFFSTGSSSATGRSASQAFLIVADSAAGSTESVLTGATAGAVDADVPLGAVVLEQAVTSSNAPAVSSADSDRDLWLLSAWTDLRVISHFLLSTLVWCSICLGT